MSRLWLLLSLHCLSFIESKQALKISQQVFSARLSPHPSFASHAQKIKWLVLSFCFPYGIIIIRGKHWNRQGIVLWAYPRYQRVNGGAAVYQTANAERQTTTRTHSCYRCTVFRSHRVRLWQCSSCSSSHRNILVLLLGSTPPSSPHHLPVSHTYSSDCPGRHSMYGRAILGALDFLCSLQVSRKAATESKAGEESLRRVNVRAVVCGHHLLKQSLCGLLPLRCTCGHLFAPKQLTMVRASKLMSIPQI